MSAERIRCTIVDNRNPDDAKVFVIPSDCDLNTFLKLSSQKLNIPAKKLYSQDGAQIDDIDGIRNDDIIFISAGEPFHKNKGKGDSVQCVSYSIAVMGPGSVGKSAMTLRYVQGVFVRDYDPTIEDAYRKNANIDDVSCVLDILDTAGQEDYTALRSTWMRERDGFILVYSVCDKTTFDGIQAFYEQLSTMHEDSMPPLLLVGNKSDMADKRQVKYEEGKKLADSWDCSYIETSAKTGENIEKSFTALVRNMRLRQNPIEKQKKKSGFKWCTIL